MSSPSRYFDRIAIALSAICIVHCLAVTLFVALLPIAAIALGDHFHTLMLWVVIPSSALGFVLGYREHGRVAIGTLGVVGMVTLMVAALVGHGQWPAWVETAVSFVGSLALVGAHWVNFQEVRRVHVHVHH